MSRNRTPGSPPPAEADAPAPEADGAAGEEAPAEAGAETDGAETDGAAAQDVGTSPAEAAAAPDDAPPPGPVGPGEFRLHPRARLEETEALIDWLREAAPSEEPLTLQADGVESAPAPLVLAIVAAARARAEAGRPAALVSPSPAIVDAFSDLGLFGDLMQMEIRP